LLRCGSHDKDANCSCLSIQSPCRLAPPRVALSFSHHGPPANPSPSRNNIRYLPKIGSALMNLSRLNCYRESAMPCKPSKLKHLSKSANNHFPRYYYCSCFVRPFSADASSICPVLTVGTKGAFDSAKNHKRQRRKRQSVTAKREKSQTPKFV